jgi:hypothetical protein
MGISVQARFGRHDKGMKDMSAILGPKNPSISVIVELNSIVLVSEVSYDLSVNFESRTGCMNSVYFGNTPTTSSVP